MITKLREQLVNCSNSLKGTAIKTKNVDHILIDDKKVSIVMKPGRILLTKEIINQSAIIKYFGK